MVPSIQTVADAALQLSDDDRRRLVEQLLRSLESSTALHPEWSAEIQRRLSAWHAGITPVWSSDEALARLDQHIQSRRPAA